MYTSLFNNKISSPLRTVPRSHSGLSRFRPVHLGATSSTPLSCLEPVSQPSRTLTPATAIVLFVLGMAGGVSAHHRDFFGSGEASASGGIRPSDAQHSRQWNLMTCPRSSPRATLHVPLHPSKSGSWSSLISSKRNKMGSRDLEYIEKEHPDKYFHV